MILFHGLEVRVLHSFLGRNALSMVVLEHLTEQVNSLIGHKSVILCVDELVPWLAWVLTNDIVVVRIKRHVVFGNIGEEVVSAKNFGNFDQLIVIVLALEERFLLEDHAGEHTAKGPDIKGVVVHLEVD